MNNAYFEIQRSDNGSLFTAIEKVKGNGTTNSVSNYQLTDNISDIKHQTSNLYYRLKQIDLDGKNTLSDIRVVSLNHVNNDLNIYPNPAINELFVELSSQQNSTEVFMEIFDLKGSKMMNFNQTLSSANTITMDISNLDAGMYFLKLNNKVVKFIKSN